MTGPTDQTEFSFLTWLLEREPYVEREDARVKLRTDDETYWIIGSRDLYVLLQARKYVLSLKGVT